MAEFEKQVFRAKFWSLIFLVILILSLVIALYLYYQLHGERVKLRELTKHLELKNEELMEKNDELEVLRKIVEEQRKKLADAIRGEEERVEDEELTRIVENSQYTIGFYSLNPVQSKYRKLSESLAEQGYTVIADTIQKERLGWLAKQSTVLYYHDESITKARELADDMRNLIGINFDLQLGTGLGVKEGEEKSTFFIHYIGAESDRTSVERPTLNHYKIGIYFQEDREDHRKTAVKLKEDLNKRGAKSTIQLYVRDDSFFQKVGFPKGFEIRYEKAWEDEAAEQLIDLLSEIYPDKKFSKHEVRNRTANFISIFIGQ